MNICVCHLYDEPQASTDLVIIPPEKRYMQEWEAKTFLEKAAAFASAHEVYTLTPMFSLHENIAVCLINSQGRPSLIQRACHLTPETATAYSGNGKLYPVQTPFGKLFITVDVDVYDPAITNMATEENCNAIVAVQYISDLDFSKERILFGAWRASQQTGLPTVNVTNQGHCITTPCKSVPNPDRPNGFETAFDDKLPFYATVFEEGKNGR